jgi:dTDP-4-amino-4,6-dideoxygalactose transaminase
MEKTFWIGLYPGMTEDKLVRMATVLKEALAR